MTRANSAKSGKSQQKKKTSRKNPKESARFQTNSEALEELIGWLHSLDALPKVHTATVAIARTLAARLDHEEDAKNARLWKEYRDTIDTLIKAGTDKRNEFEDVLRDLEASLRHP